MTTLPKRGRVLTIAGSDPSGGAGLQADLKTIQAQGGYGMAAITAVTVQNTLAVQAVHPLPPEWVADQIAACLDDIGADAVKIGMLGSREVIGAVVSALTGSRMPVVLDPVMTATSGGGLLAGDALADLTQILFPLATLITPNLPEAERLLERSITDDEGAMGAAAAALGERFGVPHVLLKGGHGAGEELVDVLWSQGEGVRVWRGSRIGNRPLHGTGCTLASAIATRLAWGASMEEAITRGRDYLRRAIAEAPRLGGGAGPLRHGVEP